MTKEEILEVLSEVIGFCDENQNFALGDRVFEIINELIEENE